MKNIQNFHPPKYDNFPYMYIEEGIYSAKLDGVLTYVTSLSFVQEPELQEGAHAGDISQYPLEELLALYCCYVGDFYKARNTADSQVCYLEFASPELESIQAVRTLIGKQVSVTEGNLLVMPQGDPERMDFGLSWENPVFTENADRYLSRLRTYDGSCLGWVPGKSKWVVPRGYEEDVPVVEYRLYVDGLTFATIYICPYAGHSNRAPGFLKLAPPARPTALTGNLEQKALQLGLSIEECIQRGRLRLTQRRTGAPRSAATKGKQKRKTTWLRRFLRLK